MKLNKPVLLESEIAQLFLNLQQVYAFNRKLYSELLRLRLHGDIVAGVGQCMLTHIPFFKVRDAQRRPTHVVFARPSLSPSSSDACRQLSL